MHIPVSYTHLDVYKRQSEGRHLPVEHCIKRTHGWQIADGLMVDGAKIIDKPTFGYSNWDSMSFEEIELIGLCTDI